LTRGSGQNIIASIRGSRRQVADIKSEPRPASNRNRWPASDWNAWPASSESAHGDDAARKAVYANRLKSGIGRETMRRPGELVERSFTRLRAFSFLPKNSISFREGFK
jgi:hypothetical protein